MTAKEAIRIALKSGDDSIRMLEDVKDVPLTRPGAWGGNHPMWIAGHFAVAEGRMHKMLFGKPNPVEHWKPLFDWGSTPVDDASKYPPFAEVMETFKKLRARTYEYLESLSEADLDKPIAVKAPGLPVFDTIGNTILIIALHQCFHTGEAAVARRAAGRSPFFEPSAALKAF